MRLGVGRPWCWTMEANGHVTRPRTMRTCARPAPRRCWFLFAQTDHSWYAVKAVQCPPGHLRKVFIVVVNRLTPQVIWRRIRGKDVDGYRPAG